MDFDRLIAQERPQVTGDVAELLASDDLAVAIRAANAS
jgi:hypothetical protein